MGGVEGGGAVEGWWEGGVRWGGEEGLVEGVFGSVVF